MKIQEIDGKTDSELEYDLSQLKRELFDLRFKMATDSSSSSARLGDLRRTIARINTVFSERNKGIHGRGPR